jgi:hypothetical protein
MLNQTPNYIRLRTGIRDRRSRIPIPAKKLMHFLLISAEISNGLGSRRQTFDKGGIAFFQAHSGCPPMVMESASCENPGYFQEKLAFLQKCCYVA